MVYSSLTLAHGWKAFQNATAAVPLPSEEAGNCEDVPPSVALEWEASTLVKAYQEWSRCTQHLSGLVVVDIHGVDKVERQHSF